MISFMIAISLHEGNGVDLGGRLNYRQAIFPRAGCAFARQDIVEENTFEPRAIQPWKIEKLDQGLATGHWADFHGESFGRHAVGVESKQIELRDFQVSPF
jgi:hypothetical protein